MIEIVPLERWMLDVMIEGSRLVEYKLEKVYFSPGSVSYCMMVDGVPGFAGGVANLDWGRGEAWLLPTPFFRENLRLCFENLRVFLPRMAQSHGFKRIQATCSEGRGKWFRGIGFQREGTLRKFGPNGETCDMYSRIFN